MTKEVELLAQCKSKLQRLQSLLFQTAQVYQEDYSEAIHAEYWEIDALLNQINEVIAPKRETDGD
jgi:hypothetical protein